MPDACYTLSYIRAGYISWRKFSIPYTSMKNEVPFSWMKVCYSFCMYRGLSVCVRWMSVVPSIVTSSGFLSLHLWGGIRHVTFAIPSKWLGVCVRHLSFLSSCTEACHPYYIVCHPVYLFESLPFLLNCEKSLIRIQVCYSFNMQCCLFFLSVWEACLSVVFNSATYKMGLSFILPEEYMSFLLLHAIPATAFTCIKTSHPYFCNKVCYST